VTIRPWLLAARPKTLSAAIVPVLVGASLVRAPLKWGLLACTLLGSVFIQIATNFINDALDFRKGADTHERLGPLRVTQAGLLSANAVLLGAYVCFGLAAICGMPLILHAGWPLLAIGVFSIGAAYAYTGGPYPLAYHGLGEIFVIVFFGLVAVGGTYFVQMLALDFVVVIAGVAVGLLATVLLVINNLRDVAGDRATHKRTTVVRFGETFARVEITLCALLPFAAAALVGRWWTLLALPLAIVVLVTVWRGSGRALNKSLALAGLLQWSYGLLFLAV
jgi:1,4-dihydroxy-2-naphthoate polyprenyltransferase